MADTREETIRKIWAGNPFMNVLKIQIDEVGEGHVKLSMPIDLDVNVNHWLGVHGGALATLADTAGAIACASIGRLSQTLNLNINYISGTKGMGPIYAEGKITHSGMTTAVVNTTLTDDVGTLMCETSAVMFLQGNLDDMKV